MNQAADSLERFEDAIARLLADALLRELASHQGEEESAAERPLGLTVRR